MNNRQITFNVRPNYVTRSFVVILLLYSCTGDGTTHHANASQKDSTTALGFEPVIHYERLREYLLSADSVVLFSHHSPNQPIKNQSTGEYYSHSIPFIDDGKINYELSVQERKQLNKAEIRDLVNILILPAVNDIDKTMCFQPRNAVVAFANRKISCFDFCFDCFDFAQYGSFDSDLIMNVEKYQKLIEYYKKHGFTYEMR